MLGIVIKSTGSWYKLKLEDGSGLDARAKGKIRLKDIKTTNPIAVGDTVDYELESGGDVVYGVIKSIEKRNNNIIRKSNKLSKQGQIIVHIPALQSGDYAIRFKIFAADGHLTEDVIHFSVS